MKKWSIVLVSILCLSFLVAACGSASTPAPTATPEEHPGKALVSSRCTTCHPIATLETAKKDQAGWKITVERMVSKGAQLDQEQQGHAIDYLALTYPK
jgi:hypothetical protein